MPPSLQGLRSVLRTSRLSCSVKNGQNQALIQPVFAAIPRSRGKNVSRAPHPPSFRTTVQNPLLSSSSSSRHTPSGYSVQVCKPRQFATEVERKDDIRVGDATALFPTPLRVAFNRIWVPLFFSAAPKFLNLPRPSELLEGTRQAISTVLGLLKSKDFTELSSLITPAALETLKSIKDLAEAQEEPVLSDVAMVEFAVRKPDGLTVDMFVHMKLAAKEFAQVWSFESDSLIKGDLDFKVSSIQQVSVPVLV